MKKLLLISAILANYALASSEAVPKTPTTNYIGAPLLGDSIINVNNNSGSAFTTYGLFISAIYSNTPCTASWGAPYPSIVNDDDVAYVMTTGINVNTGNNVPIFTQTGLYYAIWNAATSTTGSGAVTPQAVSTVKMWLVTTNVPTLSGVTPGKAGVICNGDSCYKNTTLPYAKAIFSSSSSTLANQCINVTCVNATQTCSISSANPTLYLNP